MTDFERHDKRTVDQLREISFIPNIAPNSSGSVLVQFGNTRVICSAILEKKVPGWMRAQNVEGGWITAEYAMLPYSTLDRKKRDSSRGKQDGRSVEIQRLIGRSMRAVVDLQKLPGLTLWIDCDVLQADGGTRTASITGSYVAAKMAVAKLMQEGAITEDPFIDSVAAVSVGIFEGTPVLDLDYFEDKDASVDANVVMTGSGKFVEFQATGEEATYTKAELDTLTELASKGIQRLTQMQIETLKKAMSV